MTRLPPQLTVIALAIGLVAAPPAGAQVSASIDGVDRLVIRGDEHRNVLGVYSSTVSPERKIVLNGSGESIWGEGCRNVRVDNGEGYDWELSCRTPDRVVASLGAEEDEIVFASSFDIEAEIYGEDGRDRLHGTKKVDRIYGGPEQDKIYGYGGGDTLKGGDLFSNDTVGDLKDDIFGGGGNDIIGGDRGDDTIFGGSENDTINGDRGDDKLTGDGGTDTLIGGTDTDHLFARDNERDYLYCGSTGASLPDGTLQSISDGSRNYFSMDEDLDVPSIDFVGFNDCTDNLDD